MGLLHKTFAHAVEEGLLERNPVLRTSSRRVRMLAVKVDPAQPQRHGSQTRLSSGTGKSVCSRAHAPISFSGVSYSSSEV